MASCEPVLSQPFAAQSPGESLRAHTASPDGCAAAWRRSTAIPAAATAPSVAAAQLLEAASAARGLEAKLEVAADWVRRQTHPTAALDAARELERLAADALVADDWNGAVACARLADALRKLSISARGDQSPAATGTACATEALYEEWSSASVWEVRRKVIAAACGHRAGELAQEEPLAGYAALLDPDAVIGGPSALRAAAGRKRARDGAAPQSWPLAYHRFRLVALQGAMSASDEWRDWWAKCRATAVSVLAPWATSP